MEKPVLVIMAAGMGSRYGGLKQIDPVDEYGNLIIDFSIYDAIRAGFKKVIFVIKKEIEKDFKKRIGNRISQYIETVYVYQNMESFTETFSIPPERTKPWGTGHAVLCCADQIASSFAVINADDYYGSHSFKTIYQELSGTSHLTQQHTMVGYRLENTLTENGHVSRGVCKIKDECWLEEVKEYTKIEKTHNFSEDTIVSMNLWGFKESIFIELEKQFHRFLKEEVPQSPLTCEIFLPDVVAELLKEGSASVKVLKNDDRWFGVTYKEDKPKVVKAIQSLKEAGTYPTQLWRMQNG